MVQGVAANRKILLVEDDLATRHLLRSFLMGRTWEVYEAPDGQTALELVEQQQPAVVICDLHIPVLNGFHVCRKIRENPQLAKTRIVVTTVSRFAGDRVSALESGAHGYLVKPINLNQLADLLPVPPSLEARPRELRSRALTRSPFSRDSTLLKFWGVRGSIPVPGPSTVRYGGNTTCIELRTDTDHIILDAGTGIRLLGKSLMAEKRGDPMEINLLISHTHWDHIQGLPFFVPAYVHPNRINIYGFSGAVQSLRTTVLEQMKSVYFPVNPSDLATVTFQELKERNFQLGDIFIRTLFTNHPGICLGYRFETRSGVIVCLGDHEVYEAQCRHTAETTEADLIYAREQDARVIEFIRGAHILVADAQYDLDSYQARVGWGHSCIDDVVVMAHQAQIGRLVFTHHDPENTDERIERMVEQAREQASRLGSPMEINAAGEGDGYVLE